MQGGRGAAVASGPALSISALLWGAAVTITLALGTGLVLGLAGAWSDWDGSRLLLQGLNYLVILAGGAAASRRARRMGWLHGGLVGVAYFFLVSWTLAPGVSAASLFAGAGLAQTALVFVAGGLGGMVGRLL